MRVTRWLVAGTAAGAVGASGALSVVAAHAFKGHPRRATPVASAPRAAPRTPTVHVPRPQAIPAIANDPAPLRAPAQPPSSPAPQPTAQAPVQSAPAPAPQVSGGS
jgi:hypothetical protein